MDSSPRDVTRLLRAWNLGHPSALGAVVPLVYADLRRRARRYLALEHHGQSLQSTDLIHEVYLRFARSRPVSFRDRSHFFALSARLMRQILVDHARTRGCRKRGGGVRAVTFDERLAVARPDDDLVRLDEALRALAAVDARKARVVELRYFGGLRADETAEVLGVSPQTVLRDWKFAKAWLLRELSRRSRD